MITPPAESPAPPALLLVEDDRQLAPMLVELLSEAYEVAHAPDGQTGLHLGLTRKFDVMVIDRGLPAIDGLSLITKLRSKAVATPILVLTARGTVADKVEGLDAGAEDYLVKPFEVEELLARLRALRRRHNDSADVLPLGLRRLQLNTRTVTGGGMARVELSGKEAALLEVLARRPTRVFSRPELLEAVFDAGDSTGTVDTYVYYLRKKLGREAVRTVHGLGYRLGES